ncbi:uncharacterized protein B0T15DRAFT_83503 [Chaetomium strumarium]|uniref:Fungal STAND N-terminal Goodbye domain-containing protein n=1 Tax=Chaetomium strumarium TaxID=1170767 RepID=A0AAJ0H4K5_9PEZI|nr:hypothetical protein B0T15DRAFT_83503 [Chaetomium strumarium]
METMASFQTLWEQALEEYFATTKRTDKEKESIRSITDPEALLTRVEAGNKDFVGFRAKHTRLRDVLGRVTGFITIVAKVAANALQSGPLAPLSVVLGAISFLVKSAEGVSTVYDSVEDLFEKIFAFTSRLELYLVGKIQAKLQGLVVGTLVCILRITARAEKLVRDGRWKKYTQLLFLGRDEKIKELLLELGKLLDCEHRLVAAMAYTINLRLDSKTDTLVESSTKSLGELQQVRAALEDIRPDAARARIEEHLMTDTHRKSLAIDHEYRETALKSSGEWLLAEPAFLDWLDRKLRTLFIRGGPGTGKSYLSSISITKAKTTYPSDDFERHSTSVAYFYIKEHDQDLLHLANMLKSLAYQISQSDSAFRSHAIQVLSKPESVVTPRMLWAHLFLNFFQSSKAQSSALIILDGLDEAPRKTQRDIFALLASIHPPVGQTAYYRLQVALFARPEVSEHFPVGFGHGIATIEISNKNEGDIAAYVKEHAMRILVVRQTLRQQTKKAAAQLARDIRACVLSKADGMFFKVALIMDRLANKETRAALFAAIDASPPGLDAMLSHIFARLLVADEDVDVDDFREILLWMSFAKRPLYLAELYGIVRERTGRPPDALEARMRGRFATLFKVGSASGSEKWHQGAFAALDDNEEFDIDDAEFDSDNDDSSNIDGQDQDSLGVIASHGHEHNGGRNRSRARVGDMGTLNRETMERFWAVDVRFAHSSIRDFVVSNSATGIGVYINPRAADAGIALQCINLILHTPNPEEMVDSCSPLWYATTYFADHLLSVDLDIAPQRQEQEFVTTLCKLFFNDGNLLRLIDKLYYCSYAKALHQFFVDPSFLTAIQTRFLARARKEWYTPAEWSWIQTCLSKRVEFLRPLARQAARMWLTRTGHDDVAYLWAERRQLFHVWIVHCFLHGERSPEDCWHSDIDIGRLVALKPPDTDTITAFLDFHPSIEKTCHWHTAIGWLLYQLSQADAAVEHFTEAVRLDSQCWSAVRGLGFSSARAMEYRKAGEQFDRAVQLVPDSLRDAVRILRRDQVSIMVAQRGQDLNKAVILVRKMLSYVPNFLSDLGTTILYIQALYGVGDFVGVRNVFRDRMAMHRGQWVYQWVNHPAYGYGDAVIQQVFEFNEVRLEIGRALQATKSLDLLMAPVQHFLDGDNADTTFARKPWVAGWLIEILYECSDNIDDPLQLCERVLDPSFRARLHPDLTWAAKSYYPIMPAQRHASKLYYLRGITALSQGQIAQVHANVDKLKELLSTPYSDTSDTDNTEMLQAVLMRRAGGRYTSQWRQLLGPRIVDSLQELLVASDSSAPPPIHGLIHGLSRLSNLLIAAGDATNACTVIALSLQGFPPFQSEAEWRSKGRRSSYWLCDGVCTTYDNLDRIYNEVHHELFYCTECLDVCFCGPCHTMLRTGKLPFRMCGQDHHLVKLFPIPQEYIGVAGRVIREGDGSGVEELQFDLNQEWLTRLLKEWSGLVTSEDEPSGDETGANL